MLELAGSGAFSLSLSLYLYIYIYMCVLYVCVFMYVCVCVCMHMAHGMPSSARLCVNVGAHRDQHASVHTFCVCFAAEGVLAAEKMACIDPRHFLCTCTCAYTHTRIRA